MKQVLFKVEEKSDGYLDVSFSGQISKTEMTRTIMGVVSVGFTIFEVIQHYIH
ncbi:hypothetical protein [Crenothrix sp.]|jgi:hypothetical protein|uniref:hypothetical protein n=1 Tax=Crenothrix sp. TaxID=3100433 RepID=UPI00374DB529